MAKKKKPTFGQKPLPVAPEALAEAPYQPIQPLTNLMEIEGRLMIGQTSRQIVEHQAQFMHPFAAKQLSDWATAHPTMDPRTYVPLAMSYVSPWGKDGQDVAKADIANQIREGVFGSAPGVSVNPVGSAGNTTPGAIPPPAFDQQQKDSDNPIMNVLGAIVGGVTGIPKALDLVQTAARGVQYGLMSGYDTMQAVPRTILGLDEKQQKIAKELGLTEEEAAIAFQPSPTAKALGIGKMPEGETGGGTTGADMTPTGPKGSSMMVMPGGGPMGGMLGNVQTTRRGINDLTDDRRSLIDQARTRYQQENSTLDIVKSIGVQSPAGQIARDPSLLTDDTGWLAGSEKIQKQTLDASLRAYDLRTVDQVARGVAPVGWTPGRGVAGVAFQPDTVAYNTLSGVVDFSGNLFGDPVNAIPVNLASKTIRGARPLGKALKPEQARVVVQTTTPQFGSPASGIAAARESARGVAARQGLDISGTVVDPSLLARTGTRIDPDTGRVTTPHGSFVMGEQAWTFLNSGRGQRMVDDIVNTTSASEIWARSGRRLDPEFAQQLARLGTAGEVRAALGSRMGMDLMDPASLSSFGSNTPAIFRNMALKDNPILHFFRKAPHANVMDAEDTEQTVTQLERFMRGAGMGWEQISPLLDEVIAADNGIDRYAAIYGRQAKGGIAAKDGILATVASHIATKTGISDADARRVTLAYDGALDEAKRAWVNKSLGDGTFASDVDGSVGRSLLMSEMLSRTMLLPDYRRMRDTMNMVGRIRRTANITDPDSKVVDAITAVTSAWKSSVLVRPAYILREVGEMQFAASLAGYGSVFKDPVNLIGLAISTASAKEATSMSGRVAKALSGGGIQPEHLAYLAQEGVRGRRTRTAAYKAMGGVGDVVNYLHLKEGMAALWPSFNMDAARINGDGMFEAYNKAMENPVDAPGNIRQMYGGMSGLHSNGNFAIDERAARAVSRDVATALRDDATQQRDYIDGFIGKLEKVTGDPDMRNIADPAVSRTETLRRFRDGTRDMKIKAQPDLLGRTKKQDTDYIAGYEDILTLLTASDPALLDAVATGKFAGMPLTIDNKALRAHIKSLLESPAKDDLPEAMSYWKGSSGPGGTLMDRFSGGVTDFFHMTGETSDLLARGPLLRQAYTDRVLELLPAMSPAAKAHAVASLRNAGDHELAKTIQMAGRANGTLTAEEADLLAMQFARNESKRIFYDAQERQNWALALRAVSPFAQATVNTFRRWGELSLRNPQLMYRTVKPLNYGQQEGSATIYGAVGAATAGLPGPVGAAGRTLGALYSPGSDYGWTTPDQRQLGVDGFFFTSTGGDKRFAYPGVGVLMSLATGAPDGVISASSLSGLNVAGTGFSPGVGPLVTLPASLFAENMPNQDDWLGEAARFTFPYGLPSGSIPEKAWGSLMPTIGQKIAKTSYNDTDLANQAVKMIPVLASQGDYFEPDGTITASNQRRLVNDATVLASRMMVFNAVLGWFTPATTTALTQTAIKNGADGDAKRLILQSKLKEEWDRYTAPPIGYERGSANFVNDFGMTGLLSVLPSTKTRGPQPTNDIWHFRNNEPDAYSENVGVIGYFFAGGDPFSNDPNAPTNRPSSYSTELYKAQKLSGERSQKSPDEYVEDAMRQFGWMLFSPKSREIDTTSAMSREEKANARASLRRDVQDITGGAWTGKPIDGGSFTRKMKEMESALNDPAVQSLQSAPYIKAYLDARTQAIDELVRRGGTDNLTSKSNADIRAALEDVAYGLNAADKTGGFNNAWVQLFSSEFEQE